MSDLLPCPFCGGTDLDVKMMWVYCEGCSADGPTGAGYENSAILAWNTRSRLAFEAQLKANIMYAIGPGQEKGPSDG